MEKAEWKTIVATYQNLQRGGRFGRSSNYPRPLCAALVSDVPQPGGVLVAGPCRWRLLAGALLVRVFIIFHDCGHGSFFKSRMANDAVGFIAGILTFTPYYHWRWEHAIHHGTAGDLDRRGTGDVWTLTVQEYLESSRWKKFAYRLARNPFVLFVIAPLFLFLIRQRFPSPKANRRERHSVYAMNLAILGNGHRVELDFRLQGVSVDSIDHR